MNENKLKQLLSDIKSGQVEIDEALERLRTLPFEDMEFAKLDVHREIRQGLPEVVFCQNKTTEQVMAILQKLWSHHDKVMATRVSEEMAKAIQQKFPQANYNSISRLLVLQQEKPGISVENTPFGMVVSAGTADIPVAEEAAQTIEFLGSKVEKAYDVGVAGIHRLFDKAERLLKADVVISVAGMEGALTSVVGGLVACPVIGVPTSVGYGASFGGLAPLLSMLNSCAAGVSVVNIDNGFGAGVLAHFILRRIQKGAHS